MRRGATLYELTWVIVTVTLILNIGAQVVALVEPLLRTARQAPLARLELVCDRLRLDAADGIHVTPQGLRTGAHRWHLEHGTLCRDQASLLSVTQAVWQEERGRVAVTLTVPGQPPHLLEFWP